MNIVVVGGGTTNRFGNDFVVRAKTEGHTVKVLSHRSSKDSDMTTNFLNLEETVRKFNLITEDLAVIDILIYNSNYKGHPNDKKLFTSQATLKEKLYLYGFYVHAIIPHALSVESLKKMTSNSKIFFMTTDVIYDRNRIENSDKLGYYGGKSYQHQLMLALADHNDKNVTVSSISPYFNYEDRASYSNTFSNVYNHIMTKSVVNRTVFDCWE